MPANAAAATSSASFPLKILALDRKYYQGEAVSLSAANQRGTFDILAGHTNFFSLLKPGPVVINTGSKGLEMTISSGIIKVSEGSVTLFVNI